VLLRTSANALPAHLAHGDFIGPCATEPVCGNGACEAGETCSSCPQDCSAGLYTCTCVGIDPPALDSCGNCGIGGDNGQVRTCVSPEDANNICEYTDGPCNDPNLAGCDGSMTFVYGWECTPN